MNTYVLSRDQKPDTVNIYILFYLFVCFLFNLYLRLPVSIFCDVAYVTDSFLMLLCVVPELRRKFDFFNCQTITNRT